MKALVVALALLIPTAAAAQRPPVEDKAALEALLPGTWFAVNLDTGAPRNRTPGLGLEGCRRPIDGPAAGDLSFRRRDGGWEMAHGGAPFAKAQVGSIMMGSRHLLQIGDQTIKIIKEAPDGTPRIFTYTGDPDDEVEISFQRCPAR